MATSSSSSCNCAGLHTSFSSRDLSVVKLEEDKNHLEQEVFNLQERILGRAEANDIKLVKWKLSKVVFRIRTHGGEPKKRRKF